MTSKIFRLNSTDVILQDYQDGQGKIIISNDDRGYNFSYYWGSMGSGSCLSDFLIRINSEYFARKLGTCKEIFDADKTFRVIRKTLKKELPWYKHLEFQKEFRVKLNDFQSQCSDDVNGFYYFLRDFTESLDYYLVEGSDRDEVKSIIDNLFSYSDYICTKPSPETIWLEDFHGKLKKYLTTSQVPQPTL
jgi:hypothetical protein